MAGGLGIEWGSAEVGQIRSGAARSSPTLSRLPAWRNAFAARAVGGQCVSRRLPPAGACLSLHAQVSNFNPAEDYHQQYLEKGGRFGQPQSAAKSCSDPIRCYG